jgi:hypothetical protein
MLGVECGKRLPVKDLVVRSAAEQGAVPEFSDANARRDEHKMKRFILAAFAALMIAPACASATTAWYDEREPIPKGKAVAIESSGKIILTLKRQHFPAIKVKCFASGVEAVWNVVGEGRDEARSIKFLCGGVETCEKPVVKPLALPWLSRLYGEEHPLLDEWSGVAIDFACKSASGRVDYGVFSGTLIPEQGDADEQCEGIGDDLDNELRFQPSGPHLSGAPGSELVVLGFYKLGYKGHGITGEVFPCKSQGVGK